jgi:hypothetical protein
MRQYRITTSNNLPSSDDDCVLDPSDPIHEFKAVHEMGGMGSGAALTAYMNKQTPTILGNTKGQEAREQNIKPGTNEWFKHWFGTGTSNWK